MGFLAQQKKCYSALIASDNRASLFEIFAFSSIFTYKIRGNLQRVYAW